MRNAFIWLIEFYQKHISSWLPRTCKYHPTCSAYAKEAIRVHGALRGSALAFWRVLRCNPFSDGGYDPVPPKKAGVKRPAEPGRSRRRLPE